MITVKPDAKIAIVMPHQNKALSMALQQATLEQLGQIQKGKDLKSIVHSLFQDKITDNKSNHVLLDILKTNSVFKQFGNFTDELKTLLTTLKSDPQIAPKLAKLETALKSISALDVPALKGQIANSGVFMESKIASVLQPMQTIRQTLETLQQALSQSSHNEAKNLSQNLTALLEHPVLENAHEDSASARILITTLRTLTDTIERILPKMDTLTPKETKLSQEIRTGAERLTPFTKPEQLLVQTQLEEKLGHDVKSSLMQLSEEIKSLNTPISNEVQGQLDKLMTHIDYHQLLSHLNGSNSLYFPFSWDQLEEGSLAFKKATQNKFYCEIHLKLKEYGTLDLMMAMYDDHQLEIHAYTEKSALKERIQEHISTLRTLLKEAGITVKAIRVLETKEAAIASAYTQEESDLHSGFEVKV